jgi:hypothetical protein
MFCALACAGVTARVNFTYDPAGRVTRVQDNLGRWFDYTLSADGQVTHEEARDTLLNQRTQVREAEYDKHGRLVKSLGPL